MDLYTINYIKNNELISHYLRENSYIYRRLNRKEITMKELETDAKKYFKMTLENKIENFKENIDLLTTFMDVLK